MAQDDEFSKLQQAEYDGVVFPVRSCRILTGSAAAFHKFPHRPGQRIELTGREPVTGVIVAPMFSTLPFEGNGRNVFWPQGMSLLREKAQAQKTAALTIPVWGVLERALIRLEEDYDANVRDGCYLTIHFAEDRGDLIAKGTVSAAGKVEELASNLDNELAALQLALSQAIEDAQGNAYTDLATAIGALLAMKDRAEASLNNRLTMASRIVGALDDLVTTAASTFEDPVNWEAREALLDLKLAVQDVAIEGSSAARAVKAYVTAKAMTAVDVATATGNTVDEVIALNALPDPGDIPEGEALVVYAR